MPLDLAALLPPAGAGEGDAFTVAEVADFPSHFVARDASGRACAMLGSVDERIRAPLRLSGLDVQYSVSCLVRLPDRSEARHMLTVITCTGDAEEAEAYFLQVMGTLMVLVGSRPKLQDIAEAVARLAAIFQKLTTPGRESVTGVLGELVVIALATNAVRAVEAWRADPDERYDFATGALRLEVKTSMTQRRVHEISFEQCAVPPGCCGILASLTVERSAGGMSLEALLRAIRERLGADAAAALKLEQTLADTLGASLPEALNFRFDMERAKASVRFFYLSDIPAVRGDLEPGVSAVRFLSDLSHCLSAAAETIGRECPAFAAFA